MAIRLTAWLEDAFESQLLLGNQWLQDQHEKKKSRSRQEIDRQRSAYHDNGSSLDTINYPDPEHNCILQVLKACNCAPPLALSPNFQYLRFLHLRFLTAGIK
jgi:hypothetical protein